MGAVYEARHTKLEKTFALKVLPAEFVANEALLARFFREMKAVGKLDHPNIIKAVNADEWNGTHFLVMEYIEGTDLSVLVKERGVLSVRDACKVIRQSALGLQHAHEHGLVHRDVKPSNLFLTKSGQVKLLDLGLARLGSDDDSKAGLTSSGQMLGTPDYMAPEQWDDTRSVDARADLYSLGCALGYLLTGKAPFDTGKPRTFLHIMKAHSEKQPPDLSVLRPNVPVELNALFQRLLAKKPEDRFATAAAVVTALEPFTRRAEASRPQHDDSASDEASTDDLSPEPNALQSTAGSRKKPTTRIRRAGTSEPASGLTTPDKHDAPTSGQTSHKPNHPFARRSKPSGRKIGLMLGGLAAFILLGVIIIKITKKDGTTLEVTVPDDTKKVVISESDEGSKDSNRRQGVESKASDNTDKPKDTKNSQSALPRSDTLVPIFNGRDLAGWTPMRSPTLGSHEPTSGGWESKDGQLLCATSESGWLRFDQQLGDFELDLEFLIPEGRNSGILVRSSGEGELYREGGMEIQIEDDPTQTGPHQKCGSIYGRAAAKENAFRRGEWNQLTILCEGERVAVTLNGNQVVDVRMNEHLSLKNLPRKGYLGIYNPFGTGRGTAFRNVRLRTSGGATTGTTP